MALPRTSPSRGAGCWWRSPYGRRQHALVKLSRAIDWGFLEQTFGAVYTENPGQPPLPARLMAGLAILKHTYDLSDEAALCDRWVEPYFQYICGEAFFQHALVFDRCLLTRWRQRMGQEKLKALLQESLAVATRTDAMRPSDLARVVIDTTVQPKAVMFPTDAKLLNRARERLVRLAQKLGVRLRQSYRRVGKLALIKHQRYAHAHQFKRANRSLRKLKTYLGRVIRDIERRIVGNEDLREADVIDGELLRPCCRRSGGGRSSSALDDCKHVLIPWPKPAHDAADVSIGSVTSVCGCQHGADDRRGDLTPEPEIGRTWSRHRSPPRRRAGGGRTGPPRRLSLEHDASRNGTGGRGHHRSVSDGPRDTRIGGISMPVLRSNSRQCSLHHNRSCCPTLAISTATRS